MSSTVEPAAWWMLNGHTVLISTTACASLSQSLSEKLRSLIFSKGTWDRAAAMRIESRVLPEEEYPPSRIMSPSPAWVIRSMAGKPQGRYWGLPSGTGSGGKASPAGGLQGALSVSPWFSFITFAVFVR